MRMRTSCALGGATSTVSIISGSLGAHATAALHEITFSDEHSTFNNILAPLLIRLIEIEQNICVYI